MSRTAYQNLRVYQMAEQTAEIVWRVSKALPNFDRDTLGKQLTRAADSIGANIAEGVGRGTYQDNKRHVRIARGSLYETQHWLRLAYRRKLITEPDVRQLSEVLDALAPALNAYLASIGSSEVSSNSPIY